jgi:hypothetical protein
MASKQIGKKIKKRVKQIKSKVSKEMKSEVPVPDTENDISSLLSFLPNNLHLNEKFTLKEDETWLENDNANKVETNEIDKFVYKFALFQNENNIGMISDTMNPEDWIEVDSFIFKYLYKLACENKIKTVICDYGISNSLMRLFNFYKDDLCIGILQEDTEILDYISKQSDSSIDTDIVLAILRESIGFTSYAKFIGKNE